MFVNNESQWLHVGYTSRCGQVSAVRTGSVSSAPTSVTVTDCATRGPATVSAKTTPANVSSTAALAKLVGHVQVVLFRPMMTDAVL